MLVYFVAIAGSILGDCVARRPFYGCPGKLTFPYGQCLQDSLVRLDECGIGT